MRDAGRPNAYPDAGDLSRVHAAWCSLGLPFTAGGRRRSGTFSPFQRASLFQTEISWRAISGAVHELSPSPQRTPNEPRRGIVAHGCGAKRNPRSENLKTKPRTGRRSKPARSSPRQEEIHRLGRATPIRKPLTEHHCRPNPMPSATRFSPKPPRNHRANCHHFTPESNRNPRPRNNPAPPPAVTNPAFHFSVTEFKNKYQKPRKNRRPPQAANLNPLNISEMAARGWLSPAFSSRLRGPRFPSMSDSASRNSRPRLLSWG